MEDYDKHLLFGLLFGLTGDHAHSPWLAIPLWSVAVVLLATSLVGQVMLWRKEKGRDTGGPR